MAKCSIDPQSDGQYAVTYVPVEVGMYDIQIRWNGKEIPGQCEDSQFEGLKP